MSPLWAKIKFNPHISRMKGWTLAREPFLPWVAYLMCETIFNVLMGYSAIISARGEVAAGNVSTNVRNPLPSKNAIPKPSSCLPVFPPLLGSVYDQKVCISWESSRVINDDCWFQTDRCRKPLNEKLQSVLSAQFIPRIWHMVWWWYIRYACFSLCFPCSAFCCVSDF